MSLSYLSIFLFFSLRDLDSERFDAFCRLTRDNFVKKDQTLSLIRIGAKLQFKLIAAGQCFYNKTI